jgi:hypothetical protein
MGEWKMPKTTADVPKSVAAEYAKAPRPNAVAMADGDGYTKTKKMQKAQQPGGGKQFGLPPSPGKGPPGVRLKITVHPDDGM